MRRKTVTVVPYDPRWKEDFEAIRAELEGPLAGLILGIEHVGSTAVEGLSAKPIIDLDVIVADADGLKVLIPRLAAIGYIHEGNLGIPGRDAFRYVDKPHLRTHHLYVCPQDSPELRRHMTFRDHLRTHPEDKLEYSRVKEDAARRFPEDMDGYIAAKSPCIRMLYRKCGLL